MSATVTATLRHLAACHRCQGPDLAEPFADPVERDQHAIDHVSRTLHAVVLTDLTETGQPEAGVVLRTDVVEDRHGQVASVWTTVCTAQSCKRQVSGFPSGQLALGNWRDHLRVDR